MLRINVQNCVFIDIGINHKIFNNKNLYKTNHILLYYAVNDKYYLIYSAIIVNQKILYEKNE